MSRNFPIPGKHAPEIAGSVVGLAMFIAAFWLAFHLGRHGSDMHVVARDAMLGPTYAFTDPATGCQYLQRDRVMTPRLGPDGQPMCSPDWVKK